MFSDSRAELVLAGAFALVILALYQDEIARLLRRVAPVLRARVRVPQGFYRPEWWKGSS